MKKVLAVVALTVACVASFSVTGQTSNVSASRMVKMGVGATVGALLAGPVGFVLGAVVADKLRGRAQHNEKPVSEKVAWAEDVKPQSKSLGPFDTDGEASVYFSTASDTLNAQDYQVLAKGGQVLGR